MTLSKVTHLLTLLTQSKYPRITEEECDRVVAEAIHKGWAAIGADGFLHVKPEIGTIAPRLAPPVVMTEAMSEAQKHQAYVAQRARNSETLPTPKPAAPTYGGDEPLETGENLTDRQKIANALRLAARYRSAQEVRDAQIKENQDHAAEIRANAAKLGGT